MIVNLHPYTVVGIRLSVGASTTQTQFTAQIAFSARAEEAQVDTHQVDYVCVVYRCVWAEEAQVEHIRLTTPPRACLESARVSTFSKARPFQKPRWFQNGTQPAKAVGFKSTSTLTSRSPSLGSTRHATSSCQ